MPEYKHSYNETPSKMNTVSRKPAESYGKKAPEKYGDTIKETYGDKAPETYGEKSKETYGDKAPETYGEKSKETYGDKAPEKYGDTAISDLSYLM
ncbi:MAG: hypothetical protein PHS92_03785 [Candidatus Gracilibacteria bacterium]|nr:hypothetical protein [Candidatus Gracilibacteria bacterium]